MVRTKVNVVNSVNMGETIGARVPDTLRDRIDAYADQHGLSRSESIEVLLRKGLGDEVIEAEPEPPLEERVAAIETQLDEIQNSPLGRLLQRF